jgi:3-phosphoshikimate 1-carboxyvinyltransferase
MLAGGKLRILFQAEDPLRYLRDAGDLGVLLEALDSLGSRVDLGISLREEAPGEEGWILLDGQGWTKRSVDFELGENGTALRMLCAIAACAGGRYSFRGSKGLERRSLGPLVGQLERLGVGFAFVENRGRVPFHMESPGAGELLEKGPLLSLEIRGGTQSASGLLIGMAGLEEQARIAVHPVGHHQVPGYLALTLDMLSRFGVGVRKEFLGRGELLLRLEGDPLVNPKELHIEADPSSATWMLILAAGMEKEILIQGLDPLSAHPDLRLLTDLEELGCRHEWTEEGLRFWGRRGEGDVEILDLEDRPDSFPPLVALLATRPGQHHLGDAPKLRGKESDRIAVLARGLASLGFEVEESRGGLRFQGRESVGAGSQATLDPSGDHRMFMAFASLAVLMRTELVIEDEDCVRKSWPGFPALLERFRL